MRKNVANFGLVVTKIVVVVGIIAVVQMRFWLPPYLLWLIFIEKIEAAPSPGLIHRQLQQNVSEGVVLATLLTASKGPCLLLENNYPFQEQILLTIQGRPGQLHDADIKLLQTSLMAAYNKIALCSNGAGLHLTQVSILRNAVDSFGATIAPTASDNITQLFTVIATTQGTGVGSQAVPFRLFSPSIPSTPSGQQRQRRRRQQRYRGLQEISSNVFVHGGAAGLQKEKGKTPPKAIPTMCSCPVPSESTFLQIWNQGLTKLPSVDTIIVDITELSSYTPCAPIETAFETTLAVDFGSLAILSNETDYLSIQYGLLEHVVLQTYNDINALNTGDICDPLFIIMTNVTLISAPGSNSGSTGLNRRLVTSGGFIFNVTGTCRGCSATRPPLFDNEASRRILKSELTTFPTTRKESTTVEVAPLPPFQPRRRIPVVEDACYCPVGATEFRRPTQSEFFQALNSRLGILGSKGAGVISVVSTAQTSFQVQPVNCSSSVDFFTTFLTVDVTANEENGAITQNDGILLGQSIQGSYNGLAQQLCDPLFRTVQSVDLVESANSRRVLFERGLAKSNRTLSQTLSFSVRGRCRGCTTTTPLFNDLTGRFLGELVATSNEGQVLPTRHSKDAAAHHEIRRQHRRLQQGSNQTSQCFCSVNSLGDRAPDFDEFLTAYNQTVGTALNTSVSVTTVNEVKSFAPSPSPSLSPLLPTTKTITPLKPSPVPTTAPPSRIPTLVTPSVPPPAMSPSQSPSASSTPPPSRNFNPPSVFPHNLLTSSPSKVPNIPPTRSPVILTPPPGIEPQSLPSQPPLKPPSLEPTIVSQPALVPTPQPTPQPSAFLTSRPTPPPTSLKTAGPSLKPTITPSPPPTPLPSPPPTTQPSPSPTPLPSPSPTALPSPLTQQPTPLPSPPPTLLPTSPPTLLPTNGPTPLPSPPPTLLPTLPPTLLPTSGPTPIPTKLPTSPPTPRPTPVPTQRPATPTPAPHQGIPVLPIFPVFFPSLPSFLNPTSPPQ